MSDSVRKAFRIIRHLAAKDQAVGLAALSRDLRLNKATAYRYLETLQELDVVEKGEGGYRLGLALFALGNRVAVKSVLIGRIAPFMRRLGDEVNETINLAQLFGGRALYLHKVESRRSLQMRADIGADLPLHCTALGKAILAAVDPGRMRELLSEMTLKSHTTETITRKGALQKEIEAVRRRGYAADREEFEVGLTCVAVPLAVGEHDFYGALSISAPTLRMTPAYVADCASRLRRSRDAMVQALLNK